MKAASGEGPGEQEELVGELPGCRLCQCLLGRMASTGAWPLAEAGGFSTGVPGHYLGPLK